MKITLCTFLPKEKCLTHLCYSYREFIILLYFHDSLHTYYFIRIHAPEYYPRISYHTAVIWTLFTLSPLLSFKGLNPSTLVRHLAVVSSTVCVRVAARIWMSLLRVFDPIVVESYSVCDTCAIKMRNSEPIKVVRHIPRNASRIGTRSGCAVRGRAHSARKAHVSHQALCCRPSYTN